MTDTTTSRVELVTGGSGGLGRAVVERLATDGFAVGVHYAGNKAKADALVAQITARVGRRSRSSATSPTRPPYRLPSTRSRPRSADSTWS